MTAADFENAQRYWWSVENIEGPARFYCPKCRGNGEVIKDWDRYLEGESGDPDVIAECPDCDGTGWCEAGGLS